VIFMIYILMRRQVHEANRENRFFNIHRTNALILLVFGTISIVRGEELLIIGPERNKEEQQRGIEEVELNPMSDSLQTLSQDANIRFAKPVTANISLAVTASAIAAVSIGYSILPQFELSVSALALSAILSYNARGVSLNGRFYLLPQRHVSPFILVGAGPVWKDENGYHTIGGAIVSLQFGWDYTSDVGFCAFLGVGPILTVLEGEQANGALAQIGLGWRF